jgi:hypothetical protein
MIEDFFKRGEDENLEEKLYDSKDIIPIYGGYKFSKRFDKYSKKLKDTSKFKAYAVANGIYHGLCTAKLVNIAIQVAKDYLN